MDYSSPPGTPDGDGSTTPLQPLSHNQQRDSLFPSMRRANQQNHVDAFDARDSTVHDKVNQFNSLTMQSKALERKTADAALKRAMMGREEAEAEMRRYRDETRQLRKQIDDAKERERKVGERLETVMVGFFFFSFFFATTPIIGGVLTCTFTGKLRASKRNTCPHPGTLGKGDPARAKGDVQSPERTSQAPRRAQIFSSGTKVSRGGSRSRKRAEPNTRTRSVYSSLQSCWPAGTA